MTVERYHCDVCGRFWSMNCQTADYPDHVNTSGGAVCRRCREWAEANQAKCNNCGKPVCYGPYHEKCDCDKPTWPRRSGKK